MIPLDPPRAAFLEKAATARVLPVSCEIVADSDTPVSAFAKLCGEAPSFLLESAEQSDQVGRYSFLGFGAKATFTATGKNITICEGGANRSFEAARDPLDELEKWMAPYRVASDPAIAPFLGGAVGYLGYDCIRWFEPTIAAPPKDELGIPDMFFMVTETVVVFDHRRRRIRIVVNAFPDKENPAAAYDAACERIRSVLDSLAKPIAFEPIFTEATPAAAPSTSNTTREEYHAMVHRAQEYIRAGDIFQIVLAQRFETDPEMVQEALNLLTNCAPDVMLMHFDYPDASGHEFNFSPNSLEYRYSIEISDYYLGLIMSKIKQREQDFNEQWMVVLTTDHGGDGTGHGGQDDLLQTRYVWQVVRAPLFSSSNQTHGKVVDLLPTMMKWMGCEIGGLDLDGTSLY